MAAAALFLSMGSLASADDLTPPPFRFGPDTTFQHWDFSAGPAGGAPDAPGTNVFNPYGTPNFIAPLPTNWFPTVGPRSNVWAVNGGSILTFDIPNDVHPTNHVKELWLQITYWAGAVPGVTPGSLVMDPNGVNFTLLGTTSTVLSDGWTHELTRWALPYCPPMEHVQIFPAIPGTTFWVDQVVIDTQCRQIPVPGAAALLGLAGLAGARRRR
jgi:hypothetical protein